MYFVNNKSVNLPLRLHFCQRYVKVLNNCCMKNYGMMTNALTNKSPLCFKVNESYVKINAVSIVLMVESSLFYSVNIL